MATMSRSENSELGGPDISPSLSEGGIEKDMKRFYIDDRETYYPVFCLTEVPKEYWDELKKHREDYTHYLEIVSNSPDKAFDESKARMGNGAPSPTPFLGCTIEEIYDFFKAHLRPPGDSVALEDFHYFTFIVVDAECVQSRPQQCIVCTTAWDDEDGDDEDKLKLLRRPLEEWAISVLMMEGMNCTPGELGEFEYLPIHSDSSDAYANSWVYTGVVKTLGRFFNSFLTKTFYRQ